MPRKKIDLRERLRQAALDLYGDQGFDRTTIAQIAGRTDVTERTFFRYFADKREVLFDGEEPLRTILTASIAEAPATLGPLDTIAYACRSSEQLLEENRAFSEPRQRIIASTPALQERELAKIASLADSLMLQLVKRGVDERAANMAAKVGMVAFAEATNAWLADGANGFAKDLQAAFADLRSVASTPAGAAPAVAG